MPILTCLVKLIDNDLNAMKIRLP